MRPSRDRSFLRSMALAALLSHVMISDGFVSCAAARNRQSSTARANEGVHRTENK
jgi:hypothetical protein